MKRPKSIFVVVKRGVYRHDVGPYAFNLEAAIEAAKARQALEKDLYHEFEVLELTEGRLEDGVVRATIMGLGVPVCYGSKQMHYTTDAPIAGEFAVERH